MKIVTDSGADLIFPQEVLDTLDVKILPLVVNLDGKSYREDIDITTEQFYQLLEATKSMPTTSRCIDGKGGARALVPLSRDIPHPHVSVVRPPTDVAKGWRETLQERMDTAKMGIGLRSSKTGNQTPLAL